VKIKSKLFESIAGFEKESILLFSMNSVCVYHGKIMKYILKSQKNIQVILDPTGIGKKRALT